MIAVVYSGSKISNWRLANKTNEVIEVKTVGINPFFSDEKSILNLLNKNTQLINYAEQVKKIYFFGSGTSSPEREEIVKNALHKFFRYSKVTVGHDLEAAAKATCNDRPGIVCVIGSGSNAGFFDGKKMIKNNFGLGYALGDEGSANWKGKELLKAYLNEELPEKLKAAFEKKYELDRRLILDKIYRQATPALFLTSFTDFFAEHREETFIRNLIKKGFGEFIETYLYPLHLQYGGKQPINFVGSVAANYQDWLREVAKEYKLSISTVIKEPIYNLLNYYINKN